MSESVLAFVVYATYNIMSLVSFPQKHPFLEGIEKDDFDMAVWYHGLVKGEPTKT